MFWKKFTKESKRNVILDKVLDLMKLLKVNLVELSARVDMLEEKFRSPIMRKKIKDPDPDPNPDQPKIDDGFDELRALKGL